MANFYESLAKMENKRYTSEQLAVVDYMRLYSLQRTPTLSAEIVVDGLRGKMNKDKVLDAIVQLSQQGIVERSRGKDPLTIFDIKPGTGVKLNNNYIDI